MSKRRVSRNRRRDAVLRRTSWTNKAFFRPWIESLEPRYLLDAGGIGGYNEVSSAWFENVPSVTQTPIAPFIGPVAVAVGFNGGNWQDSASVAQWIVRLTPAATQQAGSVAGATTLLTTDSVPFTVVRGLGLPGQVLVRSSASG